MLEVIDKEYNNIIIERSAFLNRRNTLIDNFKLLSELTTQDITVWIEEDEKSLFLDNYLQINTYDIKKIRKNVSNNEQLEKYCKDDTLIIIGDSEFLKICSLNNIDTFLINKNINDVFDFTPTYEVSGRSYQKKKTKSR